MIKISIHQQNITKIIKRDYKKARERYQSLSKMKKKTNNNMVAYDTKMFKKMKTKSWLSLEMKYYKMRKKRLIIIIRNYFSIRKVSFSWGLA